MKHPTLLTKYEEIFWREITDYGGSVFYALLLIFLWLNELQRLAFALFAAYFAILFSAAIVRFFYFKKRPNPEAYRTALQKIDASSFPSVHAARSTALFLALAAHFNRPAFTAVFAVITLCVCLSRIVVKKHDGVDVAAGMLLGALIGAATLYLF